MRPVPSTEGHRKLHVNDEQSPVRKLERDAMVGSLAEEGPTDGRSSLQMLQHML